MLDQALLHGSSVGGARPKALVSDGARRLIAKFGSTTDTYPVVKGEFVAMELARRTDLNVAAVELTHALGKDVLLIDRFDRPAAGGRRAMVSALTILGLDELGARYASYADLAQAIRTRFTEPQATLRELFSRITFNVLVGNNDDHARNHAAFWDGTALTLTPAYDLCPQPRAGGETAQVMAIGPDGYRMSQVAGCVARASTYLLSEPDAREIVDHQLRRDRDPLGRRVRPGLADRGRSSWVLASAVPQSVRVRGLLSGFALTVTFVSSVAGRRWYRRSRRTVWRESQ